MTSSCHTSHAKGLATRRRRAPRAGSCRKRAPAVLYSERENDPATKRTQSSAFWVSRQPFSTSAQARSAVKRAPGQQKSAFRRRRHATPPARCASGKLSRRAHAHEQRRRHASACRRVRAAACRSARAAAHVSPPAQVRPGNSMIPREAINGVVATAEPALAVLGTAARGAATHVT